MKLTAPQIERAAELRERGWSMERIGRELGASPGAIAWHCLRLGADPPNAKPINKAIRGPVTVMRNGAIVRRFLPEEDDLLLALEAQGLGVTEIARRLGRKWNSVRGRLMTLARHQERNAIAKERRDGRL